MKNTNLLFLTNDWRSIHLEKQLIKKVNRFTRIEYDPVPPLYRYAAAALTFHNNKNVWWAKYQWHLLTQAGRKQNILSKIKELNIDFNSCLIWGSWFEPFKKTTYEKIPYFYYIDQSCNKNVDKFDLLTNKSLIKSRTAFNHTQYVNYLNAKCVFCFSEWTKNQTIESHDLDAAKVINVGWGPIMTDLAGEESNSQYIKPMVLFVGNEFYRKGVDILRSAIPKVAAQIPEVEFIVVGGNYDKLAVEPHPNLKLIGKIDSKELMNDLYKKAAIFVLPHRFERCGHVIIEAMGAGKPIITSNQGGPTEVVKHGVNGFLIKIGDSNALSDHLIMLLKDKKLCSSFGKASRDIMKNGYTWDIIADKILNKMAEYV